MSTIIAVANQKGGVGKTTTTLNLGAALAEMGHRVLLVDLDPQGSLSTALQVDDDDRDQGTFPLLTEGQGATFQTEIDGVSILPTNERLALAESLGADHPDATRLYRALSALESDFILIDCPPSLGWLTLNGLVAANKAIVPVQADFLALKGAALLIDTIESIQVKMGEWVQPWMLVTMYDRRTKHSQEVDKALRDQWEGWVLTTRIPYTVRLKEAPIVGQTILSYSPRSQAAHAYRTLAREIDHV